MGNFTGKLALGLAISLAAACGDNLNVEPTGEDLSVETDEDTAVDIVLAGEDPNGDDLGFAITASPQSGILSGTAPNVTYTPDENFFGMDMFSYAVSDAEETVVFDVFITVLPVNDPPTVGAILDQNTNEDVAVGPVVVVVDDVDDDLGTLDIVVSSSDTGVIDGTGIAIDRTSGNVELTLTPVLDASGGSTLTLTATDPDGESDSSEFDLTVTAVDDAPTIGVIADQSAHALSFGPIAFTVDDVDSPVSGLTLSAVSSDQTVVADGDISFGGADANRTVSVDALKAGTAQITVTVSDGNGSNDSVFDLTVENTAPTVNNETIEWVGNTQLVVTAAAAGLLGNDNDGDGDGLTVTQASINSGAIVVNADGTYTYTPALGDTGAASATISYTVSDGFETVDGTATVNLNELVWYVDNSGANGDGRSNTPFNNLADAETASGPGDIIFVFAGSGTTGQDAGITLKNNQQLLGNGVDFVVNLGGNDTTIVSANADPVITNTSGVAVNLNDNATIAGLTIDEPSNDGISGSPIDSLTLSDVTINADGNAAIDVGNNNPAADVTIDITNCTIDGTGTSGTPRSGIDIDLVGSTGGTGALVVDITGTTIVEASDAILVNVDNTMGTGGTPNQITIDNNTIEDFASEAVLIKNDGGTISQVNILNNTIDAQVNGAGTSDEGIHVQLTHEVAGGATDLTIAGNTVRDTGLQCVDVDDSSQTGNVTTLVALIDQNTLDNCGDEGIRVEPDDGAVTWNVTATDNTMTNNGLGSTFVWSTGDTGATLRVNLSGNEDDVGFTLGCDVDTTTELGSVNNAGAADLDCATDTAQFIIELDNAGNTTNSLTPVGILTGAVTSAAARIDPSTIPVP